MSMTPDLEKQPVQGGSSVTDEAQLPIAPTNALNADIQASSQPPLSGPTHAGSSGPPRRKILGIRKTAPSQSTVNVYDPIAATYDYSVKYKSDDLFHELDENARVWHVYNDEAREFDAEMIDEASDSLDILLVFAGLFSAVLTTFLVQTSQALTSDNAAITVSLLKELIDLQRAQANGLSMDSVTSAVVASSPSTIDKWVNGLWFTSLVLSLSDALVAVLAKQWLRQYHSRSFGPARDRAVSRQFRYVGFITWSVPSIIAFLPTILHISLILFLVGVVVFLIPLNTVMAAIAGGLTFLLCATYILTNLLPLFLVQCPYHTPLSNLLYRLFAIIGLKTSHLIPLLPIPFRLQRVAVSYLNPDYTNLHDREANAAATWRVFGSGIPETLRSLWMTTTSTSAEVVLSDALVALGTPEALVVQDGRSPGTEAYRVAYESLNVVFDHCSYMHWPGLSEEDNGTNLSDLTENEKVEIQRSLLANMAAHYGSGLAEAEEHSQSRLPEACRVHASDIGLALVALASNRSLTLTILGDVDILIQPIHLQSKEALAWVIQHYDILDVPPLPFIVWERLWEVGNYGAVNFRRPGAFPPGSQLMAAVLDPSDGLLRAGHGAVSLQNFLAFRVHSRREQGMSRQAS